MSSTFADKSGLGVLFSALRKAAAAEGFELLPSDIIIGAVEASSNPARESQVAYTATPDGQYTGEAIAYYTRLDLQGIFTAAGIDGVEIEAGAETVQDVVDAVNYRYSTGFTAADIDVSGDLSVIDGLVTLQANPTSHGFKGALQVRLVEQALEKLPLSEVIVDPDLGDLTYPVAVPEYLTSPVIIEGTLSAKGQAENGNMINGQGNPSTDLTMAQNGELELALGARIYRNAVTIAPVDGHYDLTISDDGDWNWPLSLTILQDGAAVTDLYDVTLRAASVDTGSEIVFKLSRDEEGVFHFINEALGLDILDSVYTDDGSVVQNIQRFTFYKEFLGEVETNAAGAPIGNFVIGMTGVRREGLVEPVNVEITVSVAVG